ncbi:putative uncharacterized protein [Tetragenococcus halophilus subsp. halophilus]|nr:putative uncharacterized protein [Tetragenococcus halophilus subsp. halophilus]
MEKEYNDRRNRQYEMSAAIQQQVAAVMMSLGKNNNKEVPNMLMPSIEEAKQAETQEERQNEGIDTTKWWEGAERKE